MSEELKRENNDNPKALLIACVVIIAFVLSVSRCSSEESPTSAKKLNNESNETPQTDRVRAANYAALVIGVYLNDVATSASDLSLAGVTAEAPHDGSESAARVCVRLRGKNALGAEVVNFIIFDADGSTTDHSGKWPDKCLEPQMISVTNDVERVLEW